MTNAPVRFAGSAGGVMIAACEVGGVLGISVLGSVLSAHTTGGAAGYVNGLHAAM